MRIKVLLNSILLITGISSCRIDYSKGVIDDELTSELPLLIMEKVAHTESLGEDNSIKVTAELAEYYDREKETHVKGLRFEETRKGEVVVEGFVGELVISDSLQLIDIKETVDVYSKDQEAQLKAEALSFDRRDMTLLSGLNNEVSIELDTGTKVEGRGLNGSLKRNEYSFFQTDGVIIEDRDRESGDAPDEELPVDSEDEEEREPK